MRRINLKVNDELHRKTKANAAMQGISINEYICRLLECEDLINQKAEQGGEKCLS